MFKLASTSFASNLFLTKVCIMVHMRAYKYQSVMNKIEMNFIIQLTLYDLGEPIHSVLVGPI